MKAQPIQVAGLVYQAAFAAPVVSTTMGTAGPGGLLQRQRAVPSQGYVIWTITPAVPTSKASAFVALAFLLVASGIKYATTSIYKLY